MRGEYELRVLRILSALEASYKKTGDVRMQTSIEFVDKECCTGIKRSQPAASELEKLPCPVGLICQIECNAFCGLVSLVPGEDPEHFLLLRR